MTEKIETTWPDVAIPPGETLAETLEALGMSQTELARRAGRPPQVISEIIQGRKGITAETALEFERVLGVSAQLWLGLEARYREVRARLADRKHVQAEAATAVRFPYNEMAAHGWVTRTRDRLVRAQELLRFFGVASLHHVELPQVAWRKSAKVATSPYALAAWLRRGETKAQQRRTQPFDGPGLTEMLPVLRALTTKPPEEFVARLESVLAERGVAFVLVRELAKTGANGATRWLGPKAVVQLSIRGKFADIFWFTLFHELAHILRHGRKQRFIEYARGQGTTTQEHEADAFARDLLIPPSAYRTFVTAQDFAPAAVRQFAATIDVDAGIVVGRLQHDGHVPHSQLTGLRQKYQWVESTAPDDAANT